MKPDREKPIRDRLAISNRHKNPISYIMNDSRDNQTYRINKSLHDKHKIKK